MWKPNLVPIALMLWSASAAQAQLPEVREFACDASVGATHYHVQLSRAGSDAHLRVRDAQQIIADGAAISYRSGTRYFIPTGTNTGIKLTIDRDPASICFGAGGTDCHVCTAPVETKPMELATVTCTRDGYTLAGTFYNNSAPLIIVKDQRGDLLASGAGARWGRYSNHFTLPIGPGETYEVDDAVDMCSETDAPPHDPSPPESSELHCVSRDNDNDQEFELRDYGTRRVAVYYYGDGGAITGPISIIEGGRYLLFGGYYGAVTYRTLTESTGEICDSSTCVTCTLMPE